MKKVFKNQAEVAHVWAQRTHPEGRAGSNAHLFFEGDTIYSYGHHFPIAKWLDENTVLFTTRKYSVTTSGHMRDVHSAIRSGVKIYYVYNPTDTPSSNAETWIRDLVLNQARIKRARKNKEFYLREAENSLLSLKEFLKRFKVKIPLDVKAEWELIKSGQFLDGEAWKKYEKRRAEIDAEMGRRREEERKRIEAENAEKLEQWKNGEDVSIYSDNPLLLRVKDDTIQTTKGASIPLAVALKLWGRIKAGADVIGMSLGYYKIDSFNGDVLMVGCHAIPLSEMKRLAESLGV